MNLIFAAMNQSTFVTGVVYIAAACATLLVFMITFGTLKGLRVMAKAYYFIYTNGLSRKNAAVRKTGTWNPGTEMLVEVHTAAGMVKLTMPLSFRNLLGDGTSTPLWVCSYFLGRPVHAITTHEHTAMKPNLPSSSVVYLHNAVSGVVSPL